MTDILTISNLQITRAIQMICTDLNWRIKPHQVWGVLGMNGVGKTSLLHVLARLRLPQHGQITLHNHALTKLSRKTIAQNIGILFQEQYHPFPENVFNTVRCGRYPHIAPWQFESKQDYEIIHQALQSMGLEKFAKRCIKSLSGGERKRVAIASILAQTPALYLLDEPTNNLDLNFQIRVLKHFCHLAKQQKTATVMVLHDINHAIRFCDHLLLLFGDGEYACGSTKELATTQNLQRLYQHKLNQVTYAGGDLWVAE